jgi:hypothetical protein
VGIDIYAEPGFSEHKDQYQPEFDAAVQSRDALPPGSPEAEAAQERVHEAYLSMFTHNPYYLRESYHGAPYPSRAFLWETFEAEDAEAQIPASTLARRLPRAVLEALIRDAEVYGNGDAREALCELGIEPTLGVGDSPAEVDLEDLTDVLGRIFADEISAVDSGEGSGANVRVPDELWDFETLRDLVEAHRCAAQYVRFAIAARDWEREHGEPLTVYASY